MSGPKAAGGAALLAGVLALGLPGPAGAVQTHGGLEGLVSHQLGHLLFAAGLLVIYGIGRRLRWPDAGWAAFRWFLVLSVGWCALTFAGHLLDAVVDPSRLLRTGPPVGRFYAAAPLDWLYYASRLDHLLWVPALLALWRALAAWQRAEEDTG